MSKQPSKEPPKEADSSSQVQIAQPLDEDIQRVLGAQEARLARLRGYVTLREFIDMCPVAYQMYQESREEQCPQQTASGRGVKKDQRNDRGNGQENGQGNGRKIVNESSVPGGQPFETIAGPSNDPHHMATGTNRFGNIASRVHNDLPQANLERSEAMALFDRLTRDSEPANGYDRQPRHRTRPDRYEPKNAKSRSLDKGKKKEDTNGPKQKSKDTSKRSVQPGCSGRTAIDKGKRKGHANKLQNGFSAPNVAQDRITLPANTRPGFLQKGRVGHGVPDLSCSDMSFLSNSLKRPNQRQNSEQGGEKRARPDKTLGGEISQYFASGQPELLISNNHCMATGNNLGGTGMMAPGNAAPGTNPSTFDSGLPASLSGQLHPPLSSPGPSSVLTIPSPRNGGTGTPRGVDVNNTLTNSAPYGAQNPALNPDMGSMSENGQTVSNPHLGNHEPMVNQLAVGNIQQHPAASQGYSSMVNQEPDPGVSGTPLTGQNAEYTSHRPVSMSVEMDDPTVTEIRMRQHNPHVGPANWIARNGTLPGEPSPGHGHHALASPRRHNFSDTNERDMGQNPSQATSYSQLRHSATWPMTTSHMNLLRNGQNDRDIRARYVPPAGENFDSAGPHRSSNQFRRMASEPPPLNINGENYGSTWPSGYTDEYNPDQPAFTGQFFESSALEDNLQYSPQAPLSQNIIGSHAHGRNAYCDETSWVSAANVTVRNAERRLSSATQNGYTNSYRERFIPATSGQNPSFRTSVSPFENGYTRDHQQPMNQARMNELPQPTLFTPASYTRQNYGLGHNSIPGNQPLRPGLLYASGPNNTPASAPRGQNGSVSRNGANIPVTYSENPSPEHYSPSGITNSGGLIGNSQGITQGFPQQYPSTYTDQLFNNQQTVGPSMGSPQAPRFITDRPITNSRCLSSHVAQQGQGQPFSRPFSLPRRN
ncbi:hypothetical protein FQN55_001032 [Onygenales sp. PD_40]|nr:hypothetical protein FQN55_001032 [Onygenales sp. PD_40]